MRFEDKVVVVTGAGAGIGQQVTLQALGRGARVAAVDLRQEGLDETTTKADAGDRLATFAVDVTDRSAVEALPARIAETLGDVDAVIHCAGIIQPFVPLADLDYPAIERVVNVNLWGTIHIAKAFLPTLISRPEAHIALVSSMGGFIPFPGQTIYGATKAGVKLMAEGLYAELLETNVGVSVIMPGAVATNISENSGVDAPIAGGDAETAKVRSTSPEDAGRIILDGIESDDLHIFVGRDSRMMNVLNRLAPRRSTHLIYRQMKDLLQ
ncbi:MAG: SDR family oxidoreductase [Acidimicrobiales bacterium]|jgi:NAD(P)-dependent dehydrogenase (short-subunit alcohol dehydrogenase family)|nr:SDR family oxidoreductase [Acidimicrobiales bacterium]HLV91416.1 SDR family oxidoreductase [Acidimicrobiia bacterium]